MASLTRWLSVRLRTKWLWVRVQLESFKLKILTPDQIPSRLPITLAQLKAGNNSEELKNEIRQLLYSLYRSKKLSETIYNGLINTI